MYLQIYNICRLLGVNKKMNNIYIFKGDNNEYVQLSEKQAHNYLRHRSNRERRDLVYIGCVDSLELQKANLEVAKLINVKYGLWSARSDDQHIESRLEADNLMKKHLQKAYDSADKTKIPRNFDWMNESGNILENKKIFGKFN